MKCDVTNLADKPHLLKIRFLLSTNQIVENILRT